MITLTRTVRSAHYEVVLTATAPTVCEAVDAMLVLCENEDLSDTDDLADAAKPRRDYLN